MTNPSSPKTLRVLLPVPLAEAYDYLPSEKEMPQKGAFVEVPFGGRKMIGVVWGEGAGDVPDAKLKAIIRALDLPLTPKVSRDFVDWVAAYTLTPAGAALKMMFGSVKNLEAKKNDVFDCPVFDPDFFQPVLSEDQEKAAGGLREKVVGRATPPPLEGGGRGWEGEINTESGIIGSTVHGRSPPPPTPSLKGRGSVNGYSATLLDGVTGSGKTEVFCEAIAECLRQGKQALVMLPEIAMTAALIDRFAARFGARPVEWHSGLSDKQRRLHWQAIAKGEAKFILGARSALFLPYPALGLIVVDEEHEAAYKQEEGVIYHGRDMAVARAHLGGIPVILSSATPSLETLFNVQQGKYCHVVLRTRFGEAQMPHIELVDLRKYKLPSQEFISPPLFKGLQETIASGQQAMLFLNRRGYAPLTLCRGCGHRLQCPHCAAWLTEHKKSGRLHCHHCDYTMRLPDKCPSCQVEGRFAACGPGVERIAEEIKKRLPQARFAVMASDTLDNPQAAQALVDQMERRELDLLIGTQIMAKGYHFPRLTLVGVVDGDLGLAGGDPRACERTFQLLQQMAGRSGRAADAGRVLVQTTAPEHPVMKAIIKGDRDAFMQAELEERQAYRLPPYWRLASLTVSGADVHQVIAAARHLAATAPQDENLRILGPAPAPFAFLRGKHRHRLMIQAPRNVNLSSVLRRWLANVKLPRNLRLLIDVDPYSFL
ncbi:MAG: primosomal protein N' [Alphaproteobacteria bacterium]|nr:primosomal protein N' [Alphaproteobacteria bacterium]